MKLRELIQETTTAGAVAVGAVAPMGKVIKRQQEDADANLKNVDGLKVWEVFIDNNYFDGTSVDYGTRPYPVVAKSAEQAKELVLNNSQDVLDDILAKKFASGNPVLPKNTAKEITEKEIDRVEDSSNGYGRTTIVPERMLTPDGFQSVVINAGIVTKMEGMISESIRCSDNVRIRSKNIQGKVYGILGESVIVRTNDERVKVHMNDIESLRESTTMRLKDIAEIKTNFEDADFWIQRKGSDKTVGTPTKQYSPEHIGVKVTDTDVVIPSYLYYAIQYLHTKGYFKQLAHGTTNLVNIKTDDVKNIQMSGDSQVSENDKTQTKTQTRSNLGLDDLLNPRTDTMPTTVPDDETKTQDVSVRKASAVDTARAVQNIRPTDQMRDLLNRMQDFEIDDDEDDMDVGYIDEPEVTTDTLPAVISHELKTHGVQSPQFHQVASLPGNASRAIRHLGKKLFSMATRTPTEDIYMIGDLAGMGPNSHEEVNAVAGWVTENGVPVTGMSEIEFDGILPGYTADYQLYTAGNVRWMLIQDYIDDNYMGKYIFMWPEKDSIDYWDKKNLGDVKKKLESLRVNEKARFGVAILAGAQFLSEQKQVMNTIPLPTQKEITLHGNEFFEMFGWIPMSENLMEAEYQGRKVKLNKPIRSSNGPKKFHVYVKNKKGNVIKVNFGDPNMKIKRNNPERRKSFRARHKCDQKKDKTTAGYWSCKMW